MRGLALLLILAGMALPALAAKQVTVQELDQMLAAAQGKRDAEVARELADLELTERASTAKLSQWEASFPGLKTRQALVALADASAFLDLPKAENPARTAPDIAAQRKMMALTLDYVSNTIPRLPNFFATRDTTRFEDTPQGDQGNWTFSGRHQGLHFLERSSVTVLYRDGKEVLDAGAAKAKAKAPSPFGQGLTTVGVFGPILYIAITDAAHGNLSWSHWEQEVGGPRAVFRYTVPQEKSHYKVSWCCTTYKREGNQLFLKTFEKLAGYHGEIAVDAETGTIVRLTLEADFEPSDPISKAAIAVEYGPVEIGAKTYICPVKSVSLSLAPEQVSLRVQSSGGKAAGPQKSSLNDVAFGNYHLFRAEMRILAGDIPEPVKSPPAVEAGGSAQGATAKDAGNANSPAAAGSPVAADAKEFKIAVPSAEKSDEARPAAAEALSAVAPDSASGEISVVEATGLPEDDAASSTEVPEAGFVLRTAARLVDVGVVALDKDGRPVTDLKREDFEIHDEGDKQQIQYFTAAGNAQAVAPASTSGQAGQAPDRTGKEQEYTVFSNRRELDAHGRAGGEDWVTILLMDANNLTFEDLTHARKEMLRFLSTLPAGERVGLYGMKAHGFQVLLEATADRALVAAKLSQWMATAHDLAKAQDEERLPGRQMDTGQRREDSGSVSGNTKNGSNSSAAGDLQLRDPDGSRGQRTLEILVGVARHLAEFPEHKSLVWVSSSNAPADWTEKTPGAAKGTTFIEGFVLEAQEAMNEAEVSIYPLDASTPEERGISTTGVMREMAEATGGRILSRGGDMATELGGVVGDERAGYLLSFTPDVPADDKYHRLAVKLTTRRDITLRYRTGYMYTRELETLKERFREAIWEPRDEGEIGLTAQIVAERHGLTVQLKIAARDLDLAEEGEFQADKLDIYLADRDDGNQQTKVTGQTLRLRLKPDTYKKMLREGIPFDLVVGAMPDAGSIRIVVVDESTGRMGSVTIPAAALGARQ